MMSGVRGEYIALPFHVMVTNEGAHPAQKWAELTSRLLVEPRTDATMEARAAISDLRLRIEGELVAVFNEVNAASSLLDIFGASSQGTRRIVDLAKDTPWAMEFANPDIQAAIEELIHRNLLSANDIALNLE